MNVFHFVSFFMKSVTNEPLAATKYLGRKMQGVHRFEDSAGGQNDRFFSLPNMC